jgi:hypothetical protein
MRIPLLVLALLSFLAQQRTWRAVTLVLPHALREDETASLLVSVGVLVRGNEIKITTASGRLLGVISPYGIPAGNEAGTYVVPLPAEAISGKRLSLRLSLIAPGKQRPPTNKELKKVRVEITTRN